MLDKTHIEEYLVDAIRRKALYDRMESLDREMEARRRKTVRLRRIVYTVAASVALVACTGAGLESCRTAHVGREYAVSREDARSADAVLPLMESGKNRAALREIRQQRQEALHQMEHPRYEDEGYMISLQDKVAELDFLEAVCLMRQGRFVSSRSALKRIVSAQTRFSEEAETLLERL